MSFHSKQTKTKVYARLILTMCLLIGLLSACAKPAPKPVYFPDLPAPPRVQLLLSFASEDDLDVNVFKRELLGGSNEAAFNKAYGLDFYQGKLYVADSGRPVSGYVVIDFANKKITRIDEGFQKAIDISVDQQNGDIYVTDTQQLAILVFNKDNNFLRKLTVNQEGFRPVGVRVVGDEVFISDLRKNLIHVLTKQGELLRTFGQDDKLGWPNHIAVTADHQLLITETGPATLRLYEQNGTVIKTIGSSGDRPGNFARPKATAVSRDNHIYAVDVAFANVQVLDMDGNPMMYFGRTNDSSTLIMPAGIAIDYESVPIFQQYAAPGFKLEYVIAVSSQGGPPNFGSKISIYGFGQLEGADYSEYGGK